jgi:hypothetical protein
MSSGAANSYFSKSSDPLTPLPVTLKSFSAGVQNCSASLKWATASEVSSNRFIVEYSTNSIDFIPVAEITSKDNPNGATYSYDYDGLQPGTGYFRLKMVDDNNHYENSQIISLRSDCRARILISPNPVHGLLTVRGLNGGSQVMVYNAAGQQIAITQTANSVLQMDTRSWGKGLYMVMIVENGKTVKTEKVVKR